MWSSVKVRLCISLSCAPTVTLHSTGLASTSLKSRRYPNDGLDLHVQYLEALQSCALCSQDHLALDICGYLPSFCRPFLHSISPPSFDTASSGSQCLLSFGNSTIFSCSRGRTSRCFGGSYAVASSRTTWRTRPIKRSRSTKGFEVGAGVVPCRKRGGGVSRRNPELVAVGQSRCSPKFWASETHFHRTVVTHNPIHSSTPMHV